MGRLIDADVLIENGFEVHTKEFGTVWVVGVDAINEQPTAYDVERVVAELNTAESVKVFGSLNSENRLIPVKDAIDIVRAGDVE